MNFRDIKTIIMDVDGVLSDGFYHVCEDGRIFKSFYTRDFYAIEQALKKGIKVIIITQSNGKIIRQQIDRLSNSKTVSWQQYIMDSSLMIIVNCEDKAKRIELEFQNKECWKNIAYLGDAENDIGCMEKAAWTACPADAIEIIKDNSNYLSNYNGGKGFVYDFIIYLLEKRGEKIENSRTKYQ